MTIALAYFLYFQLFFLITVIIFTFFTLLFEQAERVGDRDTALLGRDHPKGSSTGGTMRSNRTNIAYRLICYSLLFFFLNELLFVLLVLI